MNTDERIHADPNASIQNNNDMRKLMQIQNSSQIVLNDRYSYIQNHLRDEIKYNSINISISYWDIIFESIKLVNRYWRKIFNIGNSNFSMA